MSATVAAALKKIAVYILHAIARIKGRVSVPRKADGIKAVVQRGKHDLFCGIFSVTKGCMRMIIG